MSCRFHVYAHNAKVAKEDKMLNCGHTVMPGDLQYNVYAYDEAYSEPVMEVCENCVILDG